MKPSITGTKYDKIAKWWSDQHHESSYGVAQFKKAISFTSKGGKALDVGCGAGGRFIRIFEAHGFEVTGLDVSKEMINLASKNHTNHKFINGDISTWESDEVFDFIVAWDSIFHLSLDEQKNVVSKLTRFLSKNGILIYTFGDDMGEHTSQWMDDEFYYSSIGINKNIQILMDNGLKILHLELDQYPQKHVVVIARKV